MHRWIQAALFLLLAGTSFGQHPVPGNPSIPPISPIPPLGMNARGMPVSSRPAQPGFRSAGFYSLPGGYGGYGYAPSNNVVVIQQPPPYVVVEAPPVPAAPVQATVREYKESAATQPTEPVVENPSFGIVFKDGSVRDAIAVSVQDGTVHFVDPNGDHRQARVDAVDRDATKRLNRERKLDLRSL
jgi:hypothetical protein